MLYDVIQLLKWSVITFFLASHAFLYKQEYELVICDTVAYIAEIEIDTSALTSPFITIKM